MHQQLNCSACGVVFTARWPATSYSDTQRRCNACIGSNRYAWQAAIVKQNHAPTGERIVVEESSEWRAEEPRRGVSAVLRGWSVLGRDQDGVESVICEGLMGRDANRIVEAVNGQTEAVAAAKALFDLLDKENATHTDGCAKKPTEEQPECCPRRAAWQRVWETTRYLT